MKVYEEYESAAEKRKAQRKAKPLARMHPTGYARGFIMVFHEDGEASTAEMGQRNAVGNVYSTKPGDGPHSLGHATPDLAYLWHRCRVVGMAYIPPEWRKAFALYLWNGVRDDFHADYNRRYHRFLRAANQEFGLGLEFPKPVTADVPDMEPSKVSCKYGAPMGRFNRVTPEGIAGPIKVRMVKLRLNGDYDAGGAYWGYTRGTAIYMARGYDSAGLLCEVFTRAESRSEAKEDVREVLPEARFYR